MYPEDYITRVSYSRIERTVGGQEPFGLESVGIGISGLTGNQLLSTQTWGLRATYLVPGHRPSGAACL